MRKEVLGSQNKNYTDEQALRLAETVRSLSTGFHKPHRMQKPAVEAAWNNLKAKANVYREASKPLAGGGDSAAINRALQAAKTELQQAFIRFVSHSSKGGRLARFTKFKEAGFAVHQPQGAQSGKLDMEKAKEIKLEKTETALARVQKVLRRARPATTVQRPAAGASAKAAAHKK
jgi:hypothetical protein